ncbi:MAG: hypothetical protein OSB09_09810 [Planctomycetota bacterium]|nr:hypothetical protein [Planctomycetota bacterium]
MTSARRRPLRAGSTNQGSGSTENDQSGSDSRVPYKPPPRKGASPIVVIVTLALLMGTGVFFVYSMVNRPTEPKTVVVESDTNEEYNAIKRRILKCKGMVREVVKLRSDEDTQSFSRKWLAANEYTGATLDLLRAMLQDVRDPDGSLPLEFSGYNTDFGQIQTLINDLIHVAPLDSDWDTEE